MYKSEASVSAASATSLRPGPDPAAANLDELNLGRMSLSFLGPASSSSEAADREASGKEEEEEKWKEGADGDEKDQAEHFGGTKVGGQN